jgi:hypothetical protein
MKREFIRCTTFMTMALALGTVLCACGGGEPDDPLDANGNGVLDPADVEEGDAAARLFVDDDQGDGEREVAARTHQVELFAPISSKRHRLVLDITDSEAGLIWVLEGWFGQTSELEPGRAPLSRVTLDEYTTDFSADIGGTGESFEITTSDGDYASGSFAGDVDLVDVDVYEEPTGREARLVALAFHRIRILDEL